jgi:hypothetical protein
MRKIAVPLSDELFEEISKVAKALGVSLGTVGKFAFGAWGEAGYLKAKQGVDSIQQVIDIAGKDIAVKNPELLEMQATLKKQMELYKYWGDQWEKEEDERIQEQLQQAEKMSKLKRGK